MLPSGNRWAEGQAFEVSINPQHKTVFPNDLHPDALILTTLATVLLV